MTTQLPEIGQMQLHVLWTSWWPHLMEKCEAENTKTVVMMEIHLLLNSTDHKDQINIWRKQKILLPLILGLKMQILIDWLLDDFLVCLLAWLIDWWVGWLYTRKKHSHHFCEHYLILKIVSVLLMKKTLSSNEQIATYISFDLKKKKKHSFTHWHSHTSLVNQTPDITLV